MAAGIVGAVALFFILYRYDLVLMMLRYRWLGHEPRLLFNYVVGPLREFGQPVSVAVALVLVIVYDRRWKRIVLTLVAAELLAGAVLYTGKFTIERYRPFAAVEQWTDDPSYGAVEALAQHQPADTWIGFRPINWQRDWQSFPSGHSTGAFVLAGVLVRFYPELAVLLWTLAGGCAASRYVEALHWPSDCWAGAVLGYVAARAALALFERRTPLPSTDADAGVRRLDIQT